MREVELAFQTCASGRFWEATSWSEQSTRRLTSIKTIALSRKSRTSNPVRRHLPLCLATVSSVEKNICRQLVRRGLGDTCVRDICGGTRAKGVECCCGGECSSHGRPPWCRRSVRTSSCPGESHHAITQANQIGCRSVGQRRPRSTVCRLPLHCVPADNWLPKRRRPASDVQAARKISTAAPPPAKSHLGTRRFQPPPPPHGRPTHRGARAARALRRHPSSTRFLQTAHVLLHVWLAGAEAVHVSRSGRRPFPPTAPRQLHSGAVAAVAPPTAGRPRMGRAGSPPGANRRVATRARGTRRLAPSTRATSVHGTPHTNAGFVRSLSVKRWSDECLFVCPFVRVRFRLCRVCHS